MGWHRPGQLASDEPTGGRCWAEDGHQRSSFYAPDRSAGADADSTTSSGSIARAACALGEPGQHADANTGSASFADCHPDPRADADAFSCSRIDSLTGSCRPERTSRSAADKPAIGDSNPRSASGTDAGSDADGVALAVSQSAGRGYSGADGDAVAQPVADPRSLARFTADGPYGAAGAGREYR